MEITWYGRACFRLKGKDATVITDPCPPSTGFVAGKHDVELLTISHDHPDHTYTRSIAAGLTLTRPGEYEFADLLTQVEAARWLTYRACDLFNRKQDAVKEITMSKLFAGELLCRVTDRCLQFHGGYGYMDEFPISRAWRDARLITIGGGTSEIMKEILSKRMGWG